MRLPELCKQGMKFLSASLPEAVYQQILAADNPKKIQDIHMAANKVRKKGMEQKGPLACSFTLRGKPANFGHQIMPTRGPGRKRVDVKEMETTDSCTESNSDPSPDGPCQGASASSCLPQSGPAVPDEVVPDVPHSPDDPAPKRRKLKPRPVIATVGG